MPARDRSAQWTGSGFQSGAGGPDLSVIRAGNALGATADDLISVHHVVVDVRAGYWPPTTTDAHPRLVVASEGVVEDVGIGRGVHPYTRRIDLASVLLFWIRLSWMEAEPKQSWLCS
jgi:hypothetical protein